MICLICPHRIVQPDLFDYKKNEVVACQKMSDKHWQNEDARKEYCKKVCNIFLGSKYYGLQNKS